MAADICRSLPAAAAASSLLLPPERDSRCDLTDSARGERRRRMLVSCRQSIRGLCRSAYINKKTKKIAVRAHNEEDVGGPAERRKRDRWVQLSSAEQGLRCWCRTRGPFQVQYLAGMFESDSERLFVCGSLRSRCRVGVCAPTGPHIAL